MKRMMFLALSLILITSCTAPAQAPTAAASPIPTNTPKIARTPIPARAPTETSIPYHYQCDQNSVSTASLSGPMDIFAANQRLSRTVNLGEALEFPDKGNWFLVDKEEMFYIVADAGFTAVRVPINFAAHADSAPPYSIQASFWENVDSVVNKALKCGLVVIINMHNFGSEGQVPYEKDKYFVELWDQIAEHYKDYPETSLYFELYNEPGDSYFWNKLLSQGISAVRKSNPTRPIIIDVASWGQPSGLPALKLPDDQNLIASFHYYDPMKFTHQGATFIKGASTWLGTLWNGTPEEVAVIQRDFDRVSSWATNRKHPVPVFMGEFGSLSNADEASRVRWTAAVRQAAEAHDFSWGYWDLCKLQEPTLGILYCNIYLYNSVNPGNIDILHALIPKP